MDSGGRINDWAAMTSTVERVDHYRNADVRARIVEFLGGDDLENPTCCYLAGGDVDQPNCTTIMELAR